MKPLSSDFYSTVDPEVLNKAAKRGTAIHNAVENYAKFGIYDLYIAPEPKTQQQIADEEHVDLSTVFRDQKAGISKLSALIFGWLD